MSAGLYHGTFTIPAAGSQPAQLDPTPQTAGSVLIYNHTTNSTIYIGGTSGTATLSSTTGIPVIAGQSIGVELGDTGAVYIVGTENDVVRFLATDKPLV